MFEAIRTANLFGFPSKYDQWLEQRIISSPRLIQPIFLKKKHHNHSKKFKKLHIKCSRERKRIKKRKEC